MRKLRERTLRRLIREEIQLLTESTRSQIGYIDKGGRIVSTYVHYDGYPKGVGKIAKNYYGGGRVKKLLAIDKGAGISVLDKDMNGGPGHTFNNPIEGQTVFYGRDRGEKEKMGLMGKLDDVAKYIKRAASQMDAEYVYLYNEKDGKWYYADTEKDKELRPL